jgi:hypothetical protein
LADAGDVSVAEDSEAAFEEPVLPAVAIDVLIAEEGDDGLRDRETSRHSV